MWRPFYHGRERAAPRRALAVGVSCREYTRKLPMPHEDVPMGDGAALLALAAALERLLAALATPLLAEFLSAWPRPDAARAVDAAQIPVLRHLPLAGRAAPPAYTSFVAELARHGDALAWRRSYPSGAAPEAFLDNYGWTELVGLTGPVPSRELAAGLLLLGPHTCYPPHRHEAEEVYVPLAGTAGWRRGAAPWIHAPPGSVIHHPRWMTHSMQTGAEPLLAAYLWRSDDLGQKARLDAP
jgi:hypothetical protein